MGGLHVLSLQISIMNKLIIYLIKLIIYLIKLIIYLIKLIIYLFKCRLPQYSIFCLSFALAMIALGFVGLINQSEYEDKTQDKMKEVFCRYNLTHHGEFESKIDSILSNVSILDLIPASFLT